MFKNNVVNNIPKTKKIKLTKKLPRSTNMAFPVRKWFFKRDREFRDIW